MISREDEEEHERSAAAALCFDAVLTPHPSEINDRAWADLDWSVVCGAIAARCAGEDARDLALRMSSLSKAAASRRSAEILEVVSLFDNGGDLPVRSLMSVSELLVRAEKGDVLEANELIAIADTIGSSVELARALSSRAESLPKLSEHRNVVSDERELAKRIRSTFDAAGEIVDRASKDLGPLRRRAQRLRTSILKRLDVYLKTQRFAGILQDDYVTIRGERYVLPIRSGERGDMPGIVHGQSGSGATLFIEPDDLIPLNNDLQLARMDVVNEERRILRELVGAVAARLYALQANSEFAAYIDLSVACARMCAEIGARCAGGDGESILLRSARHPVLALRELAGELTVVPNHIPFSDDARGLMVSGPNTGGKTVTLKTLGLFALMRRAGLLLSADPVSQFPLFDRVFTDIGDEQTLERDLSTFSGHVTNIAGFAGEAGEGTLVLLDELFAGTDPEQASVLGRALVESLIEQGAIVVVTTHLEGMKRFAVQDARFVCASMGFDEARLAPTWRLRTGIPGGSYALRIARQLGLDPAVVDRAEGLAEGHSEADAEALIRRLDETYSALERERGALAEQEEALLVERRELAVLRERLMSKELRVLDAEAGRLKGDIQQARAQLEAMRGRIDRQKSPTPEISDEARQSIEEARAVVRRIEAREADRRRAEAPETMRLAADDVSAGMEVAVASLARRGRVLEVDPRGERAQVEVGSMRMWFGLSDLRLPGSSATLRPGTSTAAVDVDEAPASMKLDLRGERVEDALEQLEAFVDRAVRGTYHQLVVVHGHGTGALKKAVRQWLSKTQYRLPYRPGERGEGGDGVTVVFSAEGDES